MPGQVAPTGTDPKSAPRRTSVGQASLGAAPVSPVVNVAGAVLVFTVAPHVTATKPAPTLGQLWPR